MLVEVTQIHQPFRFLEATPTLREFEHRGDGRSIL